jgi:hypothetical protein
LQELKPAQKPFLFVVWANPRPVEEVQMELPSSRLTVYHLYEDAFLCARHPGILGADEELYILEHWGTCDFDQ